MTGVIKTDRTALRRLSKMNEKIVELQKIWNWSNETPATESEVKSFELINDLVVPKSLSNYFKIVNGTKGYDDGFLSFIH